MPSQNPEQWRDIPDWNGCYHVSSTGRVRSLPRLVQRLDGRSHSVRGGILTPTTTRDGYRAVQLCRPGLRRRAEIHTLVAAAFLGQRPPGWHVCHNNGDPADNRVENLRYATPSGNQYDSIDHGTHYQAIKTHCPRGHHLEEPNLVPHKAAQGVRQCLACRNATNRLRRLPADSARFKALADSIYSTITTRQAAA